MRLPFFRSVLACVVASTLSLAAYAQSYPVKPVRIVVPFTPGGPTDIQGRMLGEKLAQRLGQQFIIDNRIASTPEQFHAYLKSEVAKFGKLVKSAGIKAAAGG